MLRFMLDTDTVSYALRGEGDVSAHLLAHRPSEICISAVTLAELRYGADAKRSKKLHTLIDAFVQDIAVEPLNSEAADLFGRVAANLARRGQPIGPFDSLIAAHALSLGLTLITRNIRHFGRVSGLRTASWY